MRYAPPGLVLNDFAVLATDDGWHLLHLQGPPVVPFDASVHETSFGHAHSTDLLHWEPLGPTFGIARPGHFDDGAIWTMSIVDHPDGGLAMLYTGVSAHPHPATQAVGLARSTRHDGTGWHRVSTNPVCVADPHWYRTDDYQAWRDPFVVRDPDHDQWVMFIAARETSLAPSVGGCIAAAVSSDLLHWTVLPPVVPGGTHSELECPVVERLDNHWMMLVCISTDHSVDVYESDTLLGPWVRRGRLAPPGVYAPRVIQADGEKLVLHTVQRRVGLNDHGDLVRGMLAQPKRLRLDTDGVPVLAWWPPAAREVKPADTGLTKDAIIEVDIPAEARSVTVTICPDGDCADVMMLEVHARAGRMRIGYAGGPVLQEESLGAPLVADDLPDRCVGFYDPSQDWSPEAAGTGESIPAVVGDLDAYLAGVGRVQLQQSAGQPGEPTQVAPPPGVRRVPQHLRILAVGEFLEVYADDRLVLSTTAYARGTGRVQASADGMVLPVYVWQLPKARHHRDDVSTL
ncbi:hypothetical protein [Frankia sp. Cas3]|uniref:hypothetical protein n=1 Tax=Frankia sp. Cas3 TaxID=3073926 RepID=UPI002AD3A472|nr:hypothetical protein [Frankia sp. Cas3]